MITKNDANYPRIFDKRNFMYLDSEDNLNYYTEISYFDISNETYSELMNFNDNLGLCYICRLEENEEFYTTDITDENLIGVVLSLTNKINPDSSNHVSVEFAVIVKETVEEKQIEPEIEDEENNDSEQSSMGTYIVKNSYIEEINEGDRLVLFYFKDNNPFNEKIMVAESLFNR